MSILQFWGDGHLQTHMAKWSSLDSRPQKAFSDTRGKQVTYCLCRLDRFFLDVSSPLEGTENRTSMLW